MLKKIIAVFLLLSLLLFPLSACAKEDLPQETDQTTEAGVSEQETDKAESPDTVEIVKDGKTAYSVVYSDQLGGDAKATIEALFKTYEAKLGVTFSSCLDSESSDTKSLILIGETHFDVSQRASRYLRAGEHLAYFDAKSESLVLLGKDDSLTVDATQGWLETYTDTDKKTLCVPSDLYDTNALNYALKSVWIEDVNLMDYQLVIAKDADLSTYYAAVNFNDYLEQRLGLTMTVVTDDTAESEYELLLGNTNRAESALSLSLAPQEYVLMKQGGKLIFQGDGIYVGAAVGAFAQQYFSGRGIGREIHIDDLPATASAKTFSFEKNPENAILMIGDGMGFAQIDITLKNTKSTFVAQQMPYCGEVMTGSATGTTDSAAAATALATGYKTANGRIGKDVDGNDLKNIRELAHGYGARTAVLTTITIDHATPAAFLAHANSRNDTDVIQAQIKQLQKKKLVDYLAESPDSKVQLAADTRDALLAISSSNDPFFMMVEEAHIDGGGHGNNYERTFSTVARFNEAIAYVIQFVFLHPDTALIVTADHETGGLKPDAEHKYGYVFTTTGHTHVNVPLYSIGAGTSYFQDAQIENTEIPKWIAKMFGDDSFGDPSK